MGTQMLSGSNTNELVQVLFVESNSTLLKIVFSLVIVAIVIGMIGGIIGVNL